VDYLQRGTVISHNDGSIPFIYQFDIVGPALTCNRDQWERIVVQFAILPDRVDKRDVSLVLQIQEGFFAPGKEKQRPDDKRLKENRPDDESLKDIQLTMLQFFNTIGLKDEDIGKPDKNSIRCKMR
jgi:hypothetical protein